MLQIDDISHRYNGAPTLEGVSLTLAKGETGCLLGPSGCGKTTLLRCIAGFESILSGNISLAGDTCSGPGKHVAAERRNIGMVFQDYALLPHLTALQNVQFALHQLSRPDSRKKAQSMLDRVSLGDVGSRFPHELSGGQQQRVAIARALAPSPTLLLMDEPFSNIDAGMRADLGQDVKNLLAALGTTTLIATHDHHDAFALGDVVGVMDKGRVVQWDSAYDVYHKPNSRYVANFVGRGVWLRGRVISETEVAIETGTASGTMMHTFDVGSEVELFLRPDDVVHDDASTLTAEVVSRQFRGSEFLYELRLRSGSRLLASVPSHHDHAVGESIGIRLETDHMVMFRAETD